MLVSGSLSALPKHSAKLPFQQKWPYQNIFVKRSCDLVLSLIILTCLLPLLILIGYFIRRNDGGSAVFKQKRIGIHGDEFYCLKFRTMVVDADNKLKDYLAANPAAKREWEETHKLLNDPRVTHLGRFLRKTSLDELPQLWNVVKGEMSLVGPRPIVSDEASKYGRYFSYYTSVLPGITGLWQISGRSDTSYEERVAMDVQYVSSHSFTGDAKILFMTIPTVLFSRGAY